MVILENIKTLLIIGFPGSGKSTFLQRLAPRSIDGVEVYDLDSEIEKKHRQGIAELIKLRGESWFREEEIRVYDHLLNQSQLQIFALGGGAFTSHPHLWQRHLLSTEAVVIHLEESFSVCWERIKLLPNLRPMASLKEIAARELFEKRALHYNLKSLKLTPEEATSFTKLEDFLKWVEKQVIIK
jgi:shikimate kinase